MAAKRTFQMLITGDSKDAVRASREAEAAADGMGSKMATAGAVAAGAMLALGVAAVGVALKSASTFESLGSDVLKLQRYTGGTAEDMSKLRYVAQQSGIDVDSLAKSFGIMAKKLEGSKDPMAEFGVALKDANGHTRTMSDLLPDIAEQFHGMDNGIEKDALALKLFGRSGMDMLPMLNKGKDGIAELTAEADKFGIVLSQDQVNAVKESKKAHRELSAALEGVGVMIGQYVTPIMTKLIKFIANEIPVVMAAAKQWFNDHKQTLIEWADKAKAIFEWIKNFVIDTVWPALVTAIKVAIDVIREIAKWLGEHKEILMGVAVVIGGILVAAFVAWAISAASAAVATLTAAAPVIAVGVACAALAAGIIWLWNNWDSVWNWIMNHKAIAIVIAVLAWPIAMFVAIIGALKYLWANWQWIWEDVKNVVMVVWNAIWAIISTYIAIVTAVITTAISVISAVWDAIWGTIGGTVTFIWNLIYTVVSTYIAIVSAVISNVIGFIADHWSSVWNFIVGYVTFVWGIISAVVGGAIGFVSSIISGTLGWLSDTWNTVWGGFTSVVSSIWDGISGAVKNGINVVISIINGFIDFINGMQIHIPSISVAGVFDTPSFDWDGLQLGHLGYLHTGGTFTAPNGTDEGLAMLQTGERVIPVGSVVNDSTTNTSNETQTTQPITINVTNTGASAAEIGRELLWSLRVGR